MLLIPALTGGIKKVSPNNNSPIILLGLPQTQLLMLDLIEFLDPVPLHELNDDEGSTDGQLAKHISIFEDELPDIENADIVLLGIRETRGNGYFEVENYAANIIRK